jgi:hypothetical protein
MFQCKSEGKKLLDFCVYRFLRLHCWQWLEGDSFDRLNFDCCAVVVSLVRSLSGVNEKAGGCG